MKKFSKLKSRKGFTLVETLLATFILIVISTMLINGFITSMAYSYQTSVYSKSAGNNYKACMNQVAKWSHYENQGDDGREAAGLAYNIAGNNHLLEFKKTDATSNSFESVFVAVEKQTDLGYTVPMTLSYNSNQFAPKHNDFVDNRTTFVYYPEWCSDKKGDHVGEIIVMYVQSKNQYYWVVNTGGKNLATAPKVDDSPIHSS
ncbi:MAG: prepilin-type N-terminal cleavage/methylation domain-containing protein [Clostridiales bacterium]|nr:prepilin-type N-terminal cleavage/methylation domain-containing protein [Clostridiales bacterium]